MSRKMLIIAANRGPVTLKNPRRPFTPEEFKKQLEERCPDLTKEQVVSLSDHYNIQYAPEIMALIELETRRFVKEAEYHAVLQALKAKGNFVLTGIEYLNDAQRIIISKILADDKELQVYIPVPSAGGEIELAAELKASGAGEEFDSACWVCSPGVDLMKGLDVESAEFNVMVNLTSKIMSSKDMPVAAVLLPKSEQYDHYNIVSNSLLWPLMHAVRTDLVLTSNLTQRGLFEKALNESILTLQEQQFLSTLVENPPIDISIPILNKCVKEGIDTLAPIEQIILDSILSNPTLIFVIERSRFILKEADMETGESVIYTDRYEQAWSRYKQVNDRFAKTIIKQVMLAEDKGEIAVVWLHDYPLLTAATKVRQYRSNLTIKYYHHPPFPRPENFILMPHAEEIIQAWLQVDEIRFQVPNYVENFFDTVRYFIAANKLISWKLEAKKIIAPDGRNIYVESTPIGLNYEAFARSAKKDKKTTSLITSIKETATIYPVSILGSCDEDTGRMGSFRLPVLLQPKIVFASGRADYIKGFIELLLAYKSLLEDLKNLLNKSKTIESTFIEEKGRQRVNAIRSILLILKTLPGDQSIFAYNAVWQRINQLVDEIRVLQADLSIVPMLYYTHKFTIEEMISFNRVADVFVVPIRSRDGFNRIAVEVITSWEGYGDDPVDQGVLILGSGAGVHKYINNFVISINSDASEAEFIQELREALIVGVSMTVSKRQGLISAAQKIIREDLPITAWVQQCLGLKLMGPLVKSVSFQVQDFIENIYQRGLYFLQAQRYQKAIERLNQAYERLTELGFAVSLDSEMVLYNLAEAYQKNNQYQNAHKYFNLALIVREKLLADGHQSFAGPMFVTNMNTKKSSLSEGLSIKQYQDTSTSMPIPFDPVVSNAGAQPLSPFGVGLIKQGIEWSGFMSLSVFHLLSPAFSNERMALSENKQINMTNTFQLSVSTLSQFGAGLMLGFVALRWISSFFNRGVKNICDLKPKSRLNFSVCSQKQKSVNSKLLERLLKLKQSVNIWKQQIEQLPLLQQKEIRWTLFALSEYSDQIEDMMTENNISVKIVHTLEKDIVSIRKEIYKELDELRFSSKLETVDLVSNMFKLNLNHVDTHRLQTQSYSNSSKYSS